MLPELSGRHVAKNLADVEQQGSAFVLHKKRSQPEQIYRTKAVANNDGSHSIVAGQSLRSMGKTRLASMDQKSPTRRMAGQSMLQFNVDYNDNRAADKYARINQLKGKEVHHVMEIDTTKQYMESMSPQTQRRFAAESLADGFNFSDHHRNQSALWGDPKNVPGPKLRSGEKSPPANHPGKGEHQTDGGVHQEYDKLSAMAGLPNSNKLGRVEHFMKNKTPEQQLAAGKIHRNASRLAIQRVKGVNRQAQGKSYAKIYEGMADLHFPLDQQTGSVLPLS